MGIGARMAPLVQDSRRVAFRSSVPGGGVTEIRVLVEDSLAGLPVTERTPALVVCRRGAERDVMHLVRQDAQRALIEVDDPAVPEGLPGEEVAGLGSLGGTVGHDADGPLRERRNLIPARLIALEVLGEDARHPV